MGSDPIPAAVASVSSEPDGSGAAVAVTALYRANALGPNLAETPGGVTPTASRAFLVTGGRVIKIPYPELISPGGLPL